MSPRRESATTGCLLTVVRRGSRRASERQTGEDKGRNRPRDGANRINRDAPFKATSRVGKRNRIREVLERVGLGLLLEDGTGSNARAVIRSRDRAAALGKRENRTKRTRSRRTVPEGNSSVERGARVDLVDTFEQPDLGARKVRELVGSRLPKDTTTTTKQRSLKSNAIAGSKGHS